MTASFTWQTVTYKGNNMADVGGAAIAVLGLYAIIFVGPVVLVAVAIARIVKNRREEKIKRLG